MSTTEERLTALEAKVAALDTHKRLVEAAESELCAAARQYARVVHQGYYMEKGLCGDEYVRVELVEKASFEAMFLRKMQEAAHRINMVQTS